MLTVSNSQCFWRRSCHQSCAHNAIFIIAVILLASGCAVDLARLPTKGFETSDSLPEVAASSIPGQSLTNVFNRILPSRDTAGSIATSSSVQNSQNEVIPHLTTSSAISNTALALSTDDQSTDTDLLNYPNQLEQQNRLDIKAINAPLDALLYSIASQENLSLKILGTISGRVTLRTSQSSLADVLNQLSDQVPFSWNLHEQELRIQIGDPYRESYPIEYLNLQRQTRSSVGLATRVGTINVANSEGDSVANSSQTLVENVSNHDFWSSLETDLRLLLGQQSGSAENDLSHNRFSLNVEAGLLTLFASPQDHSAVVEYLDILKESTQRQVLIEATVVEVTLSESFEAGIDWQLLANGLRGLSAAQIFVGGPAVDIDSVSRLTSPSGLLSIAQETGVGDITATLSLLEQFGDIKILSRPRIMALNNQSAVLKVVDNRVYFTTKVERSQTESQNDVVTETEIHTVPVGLVMNVTPQISSNGTVMLNIRPTLSRIIGFVNDPNPELAAANVQNGVPEIQVREMESVLKVSSGKVAIIGGLMQESIDADTSRIPGLGKVPVLKHLFSHKKTSKRQTELLVVLRPTVTASSVDARP